MTAVFFSISVGVSVVEGAGTELFWISSRNSSFDIPQLYIVRNILAFFFDKFVWKISERLIFKLRKGGNPTLHTIALLAKALEVDPVELFDFEKRKGVLLSKDFPDFRDYRAYRKALADKTKGQ